MDLLLKDEFWRWIFDCLVIWDSRNRVNYKSDNPLARLPSHSIEIFRLESATILWIILIRLYSACNCSLLLQTWELSTFQFFFIWSSIETQNWYHRQGEYEVLFRFTSSSLEKESKGYLGYTANMARPWYPVLTL